MEPSIWVIVAFYLLACVLLVLTLQSPKHIAQRTEQEESVIVFRPGGELYPLANLAVSEPG